MDKSASALSENYSCKKWTKWYHVCAANRARAVLPKSARVGRQPYDLETDVARIHLMQQWLTLRAPAMKETRHDTPMMRCFALLAGSDPLPDVTTIRNFRRSELYWPFGYSVTVADVLRTFSYATTDGKDSAVVPSIPRCTAGG